jgi:hypothetical protein
MSYNQINSDDFHALKKAEGLKIDPRTAYIASWHAQIMDPYGIDHDMPEELRCVGQVYFARALGRHDWVTFCDLPADTCAALQERLAAGKPAETVPFSGRIECIADAIGPIYDRFTQDDQTNARAYALEAAQAALNALDQWEAAASKGSNEPEI